MTHVAGVFGEPLFEPTRVKGARAHVGRLGEAPMQRRCGGEAFDFQFAERAPKARQRLSRVSSQTISLPSSKS